MDSPSDYRRMRQWLEVCRPGELAAAPEEAQSLAGDAQLAVAFERIQRWDTAVRAALDRVEVPATLQQRILERLAAGSPPSAGSTLGSSVTAAAEVAGLPSAETAGQVSRRAEPAVSEPAPGSVRRLAYWSGVGLAAVSAAALVVAAGYWLQLGSEVPLDQLAEQWQGELSGEWQPVASAPPEFPFPETLRAAATGWQWIGQRTPTPVVAYLLTDGKATALLYAARRSHAELASSPPLKPQHDTGGKAVGYWRSAQKANLVYVLVVDAKRYHHFVPSASTPLAILLPLRFNTPSAPGTRPGGLPRKIA